MRENETQAEDYPNRSFCQFDRPREIDRTKEHKLIDILTIAICGMIGGAASLGGNGTIWEIETGMVKAVFGIA